MTFKGNTYMELIVSVKSRVWRPDFSVGMWPNIPLKKSPFICRAYFVLERIVPVKLTHNI